MQTVGMDGAGREQEEFRALGKFISLRSPAELSGR